MQLTAWNQERSDFVPAGGKKRKNLTTLQLKHKVTVGSVGDSCNELALRLSFAL